MKLFLLFALATATPLAAQGSATDSSLPRFRQLQILTGSSAPAFKLPGRWLAAAAAQNENAESVRSGYTELTLRAGLQPLAPDSLATFGLYRAMGLFHRDELHRAAVGTLERIRANLSSDTARARFDYLFRPAGAWQVDIHDVALARARRPFPTLTWEATRPALAAANLLEAGAPAVEQLPLAIYRLFAMARNDTARFNAIEARVRGSDAASAAAVKALLQGYGDATEWYVGAMRFLLEQPWVRRGTTVTSPETLVREAWRSVAPLPEVRARVFGYPEGAVRIGTDSVVARALLVGENAASAEWLDQNGVGKLLAVLHRLELPFTARVQLNATGSVYRLSSVEQVARESFSGFLEPGDVILLDPSYQPLLALGTLVHEWQHILHEHARQGDPASGAIRVRNGQMIVTQADPFLAEGLAEWLTEEILGPVLAEFPLVGFGEAEKRVSLGPNDPHHLGYILLRALGRTLGSRTATIALLVRGAGDPAVVLADPRVTRAWRSYRGADRLVPRRGEPVLIPQAVFTIEDGHPDLVQSEIITP